MTTESESDMETTSDNEEYEDDYFDMVDGNCESEMPEPENENIHCEYFEFECLNTKKVEEFLNECAESLCNIANKSNTIISPSIAKLLLRTRQWTVENVTNIEQLLIDSRIKPKPCERNLEKSSNECSVCLTSLNNHQFRHLQCGHSFCVSCWGSYFQIRLDQSVSIEMECMAKGCRILVPEDFALDILSTSNFSRKYQQFLFTANVRTHPKLLFCPGLDCDVVIRAKEAKSGRVTCSECKSIFCFKCAADYHAPTDCEMMRKWLLKCADDTETMNYICANTKDCPECKFCIEKNGGCNHMSCSRCKHEFCWVCLGNWKSHTGGNYNCSKYQADTDVGIVQARKDLKRYLFYYHRWENHAKSLGLEERNLRTITKRTEERVLNSQGTWIDWQHLFDAAALLAKCRYTLKYAYVYAYYLDCLQRRDLFEYQQAQLEDEIEKLSWKIQTSETADRASFELQMAICESKRTVLLMEFGQDTK
uniref:RBR-type E3 ubiquitin transferase n=1 Tax=Strigamia maritima TaxID=126957 RepID=T1J405_STRMM